MGAFLRVDKDYFNSDLKSIDILILSQIKEFHRNGYVCFLTNEQLSEMFGEGLSVIKASLNRLEKIGLITRTTTFVKNKGRGNRERVISLNAENEEKYVFDNAAKKYDNQCE